TTRSIVARRGLVGLGRIPDRAGRLGLEPLSNHEFDHGAAPGLPNPQNQRVNQCKFTMDFWESPGAQNSRGHSGQGELAVRWMVSERKERQNQRDEDNSLMNRRVLVIDDDASMQESMQELFSLENIDCTVAETGEKGLEISHAQPPEIVVLD